MIKLETIAPKNLIADKNKIIAALYLAVQDTVSEGQRFIAKYPPQTLTYTHYRRTGTLKKSWSSEIHMGGDRIEGIVGSNSNIAPYNKDVQGRSGDRNPMFYKHGWNGIPELKAKMNIELARRIDQQMQRTTGGK
ncbi:MAG: hypothetical protein WC998_06200 [Candidatus Paceibacterota bacterium]|jgi:hypothetical protein